MKVSRDYIGNLIQLKKTQSLYEKTLIRPKSAVFYFFHRQWGNFDPRNPPPRAYATALTSQLQPSILTANTLLSRAKHTRIKTK